MPGLPALSYIDDLGFFSFKSKGARKVKPMFLSSLTLRQGITSVANNGSGLVRITTDGVHNLSTNDQVIIDGVTGTIEANGFWKVTQITTTTFDLQSSAYTNAWTGSGTVNDGESYSIVMGSSSSSILVMADIKEMSAGGGINDAKPVALKITGTTETEIARSVQTYKRILNSLTIQNNDASSKTGSIKMRTTKAQQSLSEAIVPFTLPASNKIVIGIDGLQWMFKETGLPYVS